MFSLHQLRTLVAVAEAGSVRLAAERLVVSQPAVSSALAELAREAGAALVVRDGRGIRLTPAGSALASYARRTFALLDEAAAETRAAAALGAARVRLAAVTTAAEQLLPALLARFRERAESAVVDLAVGNRHDCWDRLAHDEADIVLAGRPPDDRFATLATRPNALVVVAAPGAVADARDLGAAAWLVREPGSGTRETTEAVLETLGLAPPVTTIGSNGAIRACVAVGLGVSLLSRDAIRRELRAGELVEIPTPATPVLRDWHLVARAGRVPTLGARRFVEHAVTSGVFAAAPASYAEAR